MLISLEGAHAFCMSIFGRAVPQLTIIGTNHLCPMGPSIPTTAQRRSRVAPTRVDWLAREC
jgi:hypothetical protein